jgi:hypothetical protein
MWQGSKARRAQIATEDERAAWNQEPEMHDWYAIESEAAFRRQEWERAVAREARAAQAVAQTRRRWPRLPSLSLFGMKLNRIVVPGLSFTAPAAQPGAVCETSPSV